MKKHDLSALQQMYSDGETCDNEIFAEQKSNLLLVSGDHYNKRGSKFHARIRDSKELSEQQKLRLTKNHTQKICTIYSNNIVSYAPGVAIGPKNESELQDQKAAEMHQAVWDDGKEKLNYAELVDDFADSFVEVGEVACKLFFDPMAGPVKEYQAKVDEVGQPLLDEYGGYVAGEPVFAGAIVAEEIYGFNLLRDPNAKTMKSSPWLTIRKTVQVDDLLKRLEGDPDELNKKKFVQESADKTYVIFDGATGNYAKTKNQCMLYETYFRPSPVYPKGWFFIWTDGGILWEGELPGGIFPIVFQAFNKVKTSPRGRSPIKTMRPYQAEINRTASKIAEHQITLGDDKLIMTNGSKVTSGNTIPGIRTVNVTGKDPTVLPGRDGSQFVPYMESQIQELYQVMMVQEDSEENKGPIDPHALLFRAASQKKKFSRYVRRFENYLKEFCQTYLALAKYHFPEDMVVYAVGRKEAINMAEFKNANELCYQIKAEPMAEDIETRLGKQMILTQTLQYVGNKMEREDIGRMMRTMPYGNFEKSFDDFTIEYDSATNAILALDRGELPLVHPYDNHKYMVKRLVARMRQADFRMMDQRIQRMYAHTVQQHQMAEAENQAEIQRAAAGYIPTGGYMVTCDLYVQDPLNPGRTKRARIPYQAVEWLVKKLETQGQSLEQLERMNSGAQAEMAGMITSQRKLSGMGPMDKGPVPATVGQERPQESMNVDSGHGEVRQPIVSTEPEPRAGAKFT